MLLIKYYTNTFVPLTIVIRIYTGKSYSQETTTGMLSHLPETDFVWHLGDLACTFFSHMFITTLEY